MENTTATCTRVELSPRQTPDSRTQWDNKMLVIS